MEGNQAGKRKAGVGEESERIVKKKRPNKVKKSASASAIAGPPKSKQPIALWMLPDDLCGADAVKAIDASLVAVGSVRNFSEHDPVTREITFELVSSLPPPSDDSVNDPPAQPECVEVTLRGQWVELLLKDTVLKPNATIALSFKEAKYVNKSESEAGTVPQKRLYNDSKRWKVLFDRGCEIWRAIEAEEQLLVGDKTLAWKYCRTFSEAQAELAHAEQAKKAKKSLPVASKAGIQPAKTEGSLANTSIASTSYLPPQLPEAKSEPTAESNPFLGSPSPPVLDGSAGKKLALPPPAQPRRESFPQASRQSLVPRASSSQIPDGHAPSFASLRASASFGNASTSYSAKKFEAPSRLLSTTPVGYTSCSELRTSPNYQKVSVIGIVLDDPGAPKQNQNGCSLAFRLVDDTLPLYLNDHLDVAWLNPDIATCPVLKRGDIFLGRHFKTQVSGARHTKITGFPNNGPCWAVWSPPDKVTGAPSPGDITQVHNLESTTLSTAELQRFKELAEWFRREEEGSKVERGTIQAVGQTPAQYQSWAVGSSGNLSMSSASRGSRTFKLLRDLAAPNGSTDFFDCVVEVIGLSFSNDKKMEVKVSDYTSNPKFNEDWNDFGELGSQIMFTINLFIYDCSETMIEDIREKWDTAGNILLITNVRVKWHSRGYLEGHAGSGSKGFGAVLLSETDPRVVQLLERKQRMMEASGLLVKKDNGDDSGYDEGEAIGCTPPPLEKKSVKAERNTTSSATAAVLSDRKITPAASAVPPRPKAVVPAAPIFRPVKTGRGRHPTKLCDLREPSSYSDPTAFFDCNVEVMENVIDDPEYRKWFLHVTDFTINEQFWQNGYNGYPSGEKILFTITCFCKTKLQKIRRLKKGDRVFLKNIRVKLGNHEPILEGHIGEGGDLEVRPLRKDEAAYSELDAARTKLEAAVEAAEAMDEDNDNSESGADVETPSNTYEGIVCKNVEMANEANEFFANRADKVDRDYRLRGRVIDIEPHDLSEALVDRCPDCSAYLEAEAFCLRCMDYMNEHDPKLEWHFNLLIEIEPNNCNIEEDPVDSKKLIWVSAVQVAGENTFTNGLEPKESNIAELRQLLQPLWQQQHQDKPTKSNNPIFDFQIRWLTSGERPVALFKNTALVREGKSLPWDLA